VRVVGIRESETITMLPYYQPFNSPFAAVWQYEKEKEMVLNHNINTLYTGDVNLLYSSNVLSP
jgi:hypothetical protein